MCGHLMAGSAGKLAQHMVRKDHGTWESGTDIHFCYVQVLVVDQMTA